MPWVPGLAVRVLTHEGARSGHRSTVDALVELVRRHGLAGITVTRALEGYSTHGGVRASASVELGGDLPLVIEIADRVELIEPLLPELAGLVTSGVLGVTDTRLYFPATALLVRDVMTDPGASIGPDAPLPDALATLLDGEVRLLPVVAGDGALLGVISLGHVLRVLDTDLAAQLAGSSGAIRSRLQDLAAGRAARGGMITRPYTVPADSLLEAAARALTARGLTRVPVVDASGRLVGILSERAIVSALVAPLGQDNGGVGETLRRSARAGGTTPLTASALADRDVPQITEATEYDAVFAAVARARGQLVLVVTADGHLRGIVDDHALLEHLVPTGAAPGVGAVIRRLLATGQGLATRRPPLARAETAASLLRMAPLVVAEDMPIAEVLARLIGPPPTDPAVVVGGDGRPVGVLWRTAALRALVGG